MLERRLCRDALGFARWIDLAAIEAAGEPPQPRAFIAVAAHEVLLFGTLKIGNCTESVVGQLCGAHCADAVDEADRLLSQKSDRFLGAEHSKTPRLIHIRCNLCQEL